jgi:hypothetical protein
VDFRSFLLNVAPFALFLNNHMARKAGYIKCIVRCTMILIMMSILDIFGMAPFTIFRWFHYTGKASRVDGKTCQFGLNIGFNIKIRLRVHMIPFLS